MSTWVTLAAAKAHLGLQPPSTPLSAEDELVRDCLDAAEAMVISYIDDPGPDPSPLIGRAILEQCAEFKRFRGDDPAGQGAPRPERDGEPSPFVKRLVHRFRRTPIP